VEYFRQLRTDKALIPRDTPRQYSTQLLLADFVDETQQVPGPAYQRRQATRLIDARAVRRHRLQTVDTRVYSLCTLLTDGSGRIHPGYKGSGPLARAEPGWTSAISHVHGNFHAEAKISSLRSFPFHFQSPFIQEVIEYLSVKMRARKNAIVTSPAGLEGHSRQTRLRLPCTPPGLVSFVRSAAPNQSSPLGSAKAMITSPSTRLLPGSPPKAYTTYSFPSTT
jgi:hypothetical protein